MRNSKVNKMVKMGVLAALSLLFVMTIQFPIIPAAPYLKYDPADIPILIGTFVYGPLAGLVITFVAALVQALTVSAADGWVGCIMHLIATGTLVLVAGTIYKYKSTLTGATLAVICGTLAMTLVMIPANLFFTVKFYGVPIDAVKAMIVPALIPFNLIKAGVNSFVAILVYKAISKVLRGNEPKVPANNVVVGGGTISQSTGR